MRRKLILTSQPTSLNSWQGLGLPLYLEVVVSPEGLPTISILGTRTKMAPIVTFQDYIIIRKKLPPNYQYNMDVDYWMTAEELIKYIKDKLNASLCRA